jgi:hypothetical protein
MAHHTKDKGDLGVLKAQADLASQGFTVLLPLSEHAPFDLVVYRDGTFRRVQVKYRACGRHGCLRVSLRSCWNDRHGTHQVRMNKAEVDLVCVYCPDTDACYYFDPSKVRHSVNLRVLASRNHQARGIRDAADYRRVS